MRAYAGIFQMGRSCVVAAVLLANSLSIAADFAGGTGTADDPYQIATAEQLIAIGADPNLLDKHFVLTADLDLDPNLPGRRLFDRAVIADDTNDARDFQGTPFSGVFDGSHHTIRNLSIAGGRGSFVGLFGVIGISGRVRNVALEYVAVSGSFSVGALAGSNGGVVSGCSVTGHVAGIGESEHIGALVAVNGGCVCDCHAEASVWAGPDSHQIAGLVALNGGTISRCHANTDVQSGEDSSVLGGLVGSNSGNISLCWSAGSVVGEKDCRWLGGLAGYNSDGAYPSAYSTGQWGPSWTWGLDHPLGSGAGTITNCYAVANVSLAGDWGSCVGGLVGTNYGSVANCYAIGRLSGTRRTDPWGGLIGSQSYGTVTHCFWDVQTSRIDVSAGGTGLNTREMQTLETYQDAGWDFAGERASGTANLWTMSDETGYPVLTVFEEADQPDELAGSGTLDDPYQIAGPDDLGAVCRNEPTACYRLTADIDLADIVWTTAPVAAFDGTFDGAGFGISNLKIEGGCFLGLFGTVDLHAEVRDLTVVDANIAGAEDTLLIGPLVGLNRGRVMHCTAGGQVVGHERVGGLLGQNEGVVVNSQSMTHVLGRWDLGGLVGLLWDGEITGCCATGAIHAIGATAGGLVGYAERGTITCCYSTATVSGDGGVAGLVADLWNAAVIRSYAAGPLSGTSNGGGLVDWMGYERDSTVSDSFWDIETSGAAASTGGMGLTTARMMQAEPYALNGWAGDPNWVLDAGKDYPRLWWEGTPGQPIPPPVIDQFAGNGTIGDPYTITSVEQLLLLGEASVLWDKSFVLTSDLEVSGIDVRRPGMRPGICLNGTFDGSGHAIRNLTIDVNGLWQSKLGFFDEVGPDGHITNLGLQDITLLTGPSWIQETGPLVGVNHGTISHCYVTGVVVADDSYRVGGLAGYTSGVLSHCWADCEVSGDSYAGGLVGRTTTEAAVTDCYAMGNVRGNSYLGGLIGGGQGSITHNFATGDVSGDDRTGGLIGCTWGSDISDCYAAGSVTGTGNAYGLGGLVGDYSACTIARCFATGDVTAASSSGSLGGLVGAGGTGTIVNCYATGAVTTGVNCRGIGGLAGSTWTDTIANCYATGPVIISDGATNTGPLVGNRSDSADPIESCYFPAFGDGNVSDNGYGDPLTDEQMRQQMSFVGWDFDEVWMICEGQDYPRLRWEGVECQE